MADTIEVDLSTLKGVLHNPNGLLSHGLNGCVAEFSISPEARAAILAIDLRGVDGIVGPLQLNPAALTSE